MTQMDRIPVSSFPAGLKMTQGYGPFVSFLRFQRFLREFFTLRGTEWG